MTNEEQGKTLSKISTAEPADNYFYTVLFPKEGLKFCMDAMQFYLELLKKDLQTIQNDPDLKAILTSSLQESLQINDELGHAVFNFNWLKENYEKADNILGLPLQVSHGTVRHLKSVGQLFLNNLRNHRNALASKPNISRYTLKSVDQRISKLEEKIQTGVFRDATPIPLLVDEIDPPDVSHEAALIVPTSLAVVPRPRPVFIDSIEIIDNELKSRCLDLFAAFRDGGQHNRLDTVVTESTRILEDRLRVLSGAPNTITGVDLAKFALNGQPPKILLSSVDAEQEAAHLLFRGIFGFIRNKVHHRLVNDLRPERVLQIVGMVDYLLSLLENHNLSITDGNAKSA